MDTLWKATVSSWCGALCGFSLVVLGAASSPAVPLLRGTESAHSVALHMHASLSENSGSMEWHAQKAEQVGVDFIWWTDHDWRLNRIGYTTNLGFENTVWDGIKFSEPEENYAGEFKYLETYSFNSSAHSKVVVDSVAYQGTHSLRLDVEDTFNHPLYQKIDLIQISTRKNNKHPLAARTRVSFAVLPEVIDPATDRFILHVTLSERDTEWPELQYVIGSTADLGPGVISLPYTVGQWNFYDRDLVADAAALFTAGGADAVRAEDNSTYEVRIRLETHLGGNPTIFFDELSYADDGSTGQDLLEWERGMSSFYETMYPGGPKYFHGSEISWFRAQPHLNAYAPNHVLVDYSGYTWSDSLYYAVDQVKAQGGIVSLNHPWGIGVYGDINETEANKAARILTMKRQMLNARAWGCELVEVGYRWRQGIDLWGHLDTWDTWNANGMVLTGVGVTDSHGTVPFYGWAPWTSSATYENNYTTWLWTQNPTEVEFISAMRGGRAYFGDPYRWIGELDFTTVDGFRMGDVVVTDKATDTVTLRITDLPSSAVVKMRQGEIRLDPPSEYTNTVWLRDEIIPGIIDAGTFFESIALDTSVPSFVRFEVYNGSEELCFSNPVLFVHKVPSDGIVAERVAATIDEVRILGANQFRLTDLQFSPLPTELVITGEESTVGLGSLSLDLGALGVPGDVLGAAVWNYAGGVLTVSDFGTSGGEVRVRWGAVDGPEPAGALFRDVQLSTGRPNPFGEGLIAEYGLPAAGIVLVEVLDVSGRRVRIVEDSFREAGVHRAAWDGRDASGRPVADGVYFLRLKAQGEVLTTKAVKLR